MQPVTMQDLINVQATDEATEMSDQGVITADQQKLVTDQAQAVADQTTASTDAATYQAALVISGPLGTVVGNNVIIVAAAGTVIQPNTPYPLASSVAIPPAPVPVGAPSS